MAYEAQLKAKAGIVRELLERIGKIPNPTVNPTVASPNQWNYRNNVQFHLTRNGAPGYIHASVGPRSPDNVLAIEECHLPEASINALWPDLAFEPDTGVERVSLRAGANDGMLLVLESDSPAPPELELKAGISVVHVFEDSSIVMAGEDHLTMHVLDRDFQVSDLSFFQVNTGMAEKMVGHLLTRLPILSTTSLLDVYCGVGLFSAFLAPICERIIGVESGRSACNDFMVNLDEFENVDLYEGRAEDVIPHLEIKPEIILVDPPRAGLERAALDGILKLKPGTVGYVSCDPSTLARDAERLINGGYHLMDVTPFDLFPQTQHIESISLFERR